MAQKDQKVAKKGKFQMLNFEYQQLIKNDQNFVSFEFSCPNEIKLPNDI